jgi:hypothetical protein
MRRSSAFHAALAPLTALLLAAPAFAQPPHPHGPPPPEAVEACASKNRGDACTVALPDRQLEGTCEEGREQTLACRPARPPGPPPEALQACQGQQAGAACTVTLRDRTIQGQCRTGPDNTTACVPEHRPGAPR